MTEKIPVAVIEQALAQIDEALTLWRGFQSRLDSSGPQDSDAFESEQIISSIRVALESVCPPGHTLIKHMETLLSGRENDYVKASKMAAIAGTLRNSLQYHLRDWESFQTPSNRNYGSSRKIFVVHGHDEAACTLVARFLEKLELEPIILHEAPNRGMTIIEKFEEHSDVPFAIILLTPDDMAYTVGEDPETAKARCRQNVMLELGYFIAKLGRNRICALRKEEVDIPSDYQGVLFTEMDPNGGWRLSLAREMKEAGIDVDFNKAIQ